MELGATEITLVIKAVIPAGVTKTRPGPAAWMLYLPLSWTGNFASNRNTVLRHRCLVSSKTEEGIEGYDDQAAKPNVADRQFFGRWVPGARNGELRAMDEGVYDGCLL
jgi:hypothetical protein